MFYLILIFFLSGFVISLIVIPREPDVNPITEWLSKTSNLFSFLLNKGFYDGELAAGRNHLSIYLYSLWDAYTNPHTLQYLPIILAPFFIALHSAGLYLADIFELNDVSVARHFIMEVALTGSDETIQISKGDVLDEHLTSPNYLIGGPGKVLVDLDSVALFEKPDGTPHIIGPTGKEKGGKATIEGFERFRQSIDIRDNYIDFSVESRSLDGIRVNATDVRLMFSINRNGKKATTEEPYPFSEKAVEKLVYSAGSKVTPDQTNPSAFEFSWINAMIGLIRGKLSGFMSGRNLTEYLASIGQPEIDKALQREEALAQQENQITGHAENVSPKKQEKPEFKARYEITNLFAKFTDDFTKTARDKGVELHWIGVGTWKTPIDIVPGKHLEAWKLSRANLEKGNDKAIEKLEKETIFQKTVVLIQDVPVASYNSKISGIDDKKIAMRTLLLDYRQQLIEVAEFMKTNGEAVSLNIKQAIEHIDSVLGMHWVGQ